ncbi:MAG TPA: DUF559 domain-containing protein [Xanthobacteraceae bacterium]|jgi:very-short-patch-repair endonuclease|nr:DUF559 domain-containing protein [Xanthobacteraceae bacterium]
MPHNGPIPKVRRARARRLRHGTNDAEKRLWRHLRHLTLQGSHFRRQVPIGPYVVDFACFSGRLILELDGSQHGNETNRSRDQARTRWLEKEGYRVLRFWNNEIIANIDGVMAMIYAEVYGSLDAETSSLKHSRSQRSLVSRHPTPARIFDTRRPSPSRGG